MPRFHLVLCPIHFATRDGQQVEILGVVFRHANKPKLEDEFVHIEWVRRGDHPWRDPQLTLSGTPASIVAQTRMLNVVERFAKRLPTGLADVKALVISVLATHGEQAVFVPGLKQYVAVNKLEKGIRKYRAILDDRTLLVVTGKSVDSAKQELARRLLALGYTDPAEMKTFLAWMDHGSVEDVRGGPPDSIVPLSALDCPVATI